MKNKVRKSLKYSFIDGSFFSVMTGFGDSYIAPFAVALKATSFQIGLLSSVPGLVSALFQLRAPEWTERVGRARMLTWAVFVQALMWLPIILLPCVFPSHQASWLILMIVVFLLAGSLSAPAWASMMSQYVPHRSRGKYFSWRNRVHGTVAVLSTFAAGIVLSWFPRSSLKGFTFIFTVAMVCRFVSWYYLTRMYEPRLEPKPGASFTFRDFIARARKSNFAKFVFFVGGMSFAVNLASPFFTVYMLRELKFGYLPFVVINTIPTIAMLASLLSWGRHADRAGCIRVIRLTSLIIPLLPLLWLVSSSKPYLMLIQAISGFGWAGFNLAVSNFIFDAVTEEKRVRCVAYFNLVSGLGVFTGATLGGVLVSCLPRLGGSAFLSLFLLSGIMRLLVRGLLLNSIREVRTVEHTSSIDLFFSVTGIKPLIGVVQDALRIE